MWCFARKSDYGTNTTGVFFVAQNPQLYSSQRKGRYFLCQQLNFKKQLSIFKKQLNSKVQNTSIEATQQIKSVPFELDPIF
ncbi:hypothetical protein, partial [Clostridium sp. UBA4548]|uniref:hypothetical protein n=1 Tax=Clostridium sp. UBA4548 TaxID=1946361 RepID=UPI0025BB21E6